MRLTKPEHPLNYTVQLPLSKSVLNRELIIKHLAGDDISEILHQFNKKDIANDSLVLHRALTGVDETKQVEDAGTALRFLTAAFTLTTNPVLITGTKRLHERPIEPLISALRQCGAQIKYTNREGFAPLHISPAHMRGGEINISANISSQFVSALLMVAPYFEQGLILHLNGNQVSASYTQLTVMVMSRFGVQVTQEKNKLVVSPQKYKTGIPISGERDWSSAVFWYILAAVLPTEQLSFAGLRLSSAQGDAAVAPIMRNFGIISQENSQGVVLSRVKLPPPTNWKYNFNSAPDLVPAMAALCAVKKVTAELEGVAHLRIKESDRIEALHNELFKVGCRLSVTEPDKFTLSYPNKPVMDFSDFKTYQDHRLAMSWSAFTALAESVVIQEPEVIQKSYPAFWQQMQEAGFLYNEL
jgi:3-phosphoshikimate 1-carboxyvinyltransferase